MGLAAADGRARRFTPLPSHEPPSSHLPGYQELFDSHGAGYDDAMARWPSARDEEFAFAIDLAGPVAGERMLDVPAGGGYLAERLPDGVEYLALETAPSFAARCRARGLDVVEAPLDGSTLPAGSVDVVVSIAGVHHEADLGALLGAWRRLLRPGGRVVVADVVEAAKEAPGSSRRPMGGSAFAGSCGVWSPMLRPREAPLVAPSAKCGERDPLGGAQR